MEAATMEMEGMTIVASEDKPQEEAEQEEQSVADISIGGSIVSDLGASMADFSIGNMDESSAFLSPLDPVDESGHFGGETSSDDGAETDDDTPQAFPSSYGVKKPEPKRRGKRGLLHRIASSDSLFGNMLKMKGVTRNNTGDAPLLRPPRPTRGVQRTSTGDSLCRVDTKKQEQETDEKPMIPATQTRRGGRRNRGGTSESTPQSTEAPPFRGVTRKNTGDGFDPPPQGRPPRRGVARKNTGDGFDPPPRGPPPRRGVARKNTGDGFEPPAPPTRGVARKNTGDGESFGFIRSVCDSLKISAKDQQDLEKAAVPQTRTRRGGRRNRGGDDAESAEQAEPKRGVRRQNTGDGEGFGFMRSVRESLKPNTQDQQDLEKSAVPKTRTRRGGRRNRGGDEADTEEVVQQAEPKRGVVRQNTGDSIMQAIRRPFRRNERPPLPEAGSKRGGRRPSKTSPEPMLGDCSTAEESDSSGGNHAAASASSASD